MSRPFSSSRTDAGDPHSTASQSEISRFSDRAERLRRLAALVAVGDTPLPVELEPRELSIVLAEVARLRHDRLVRFVARAIAADLHNTRES